MRELRGGIAKPGSHNAERHNHCGPVGCIVGRPDGFPDERMTAHRDPSHCRT